MRKITLFIFVASIISFFAYGQNLQRKALNKIPDNWKTLNQANYSIHFPDTFMLDKSGDMGLNFVLYSLQTSYQDNFLENINLITQNLVGENINLDRYVEISEDQIAIFISNGKIVESERIMGENNREYHRIIYTGKQFEFDLKWLQHYWIIDEIAYVLTLSCEIHEFENYIEVGEKIMKTFSVE